MIPVLQTERLTLRPYQRADFDAYCGLMTGARSKHMGGPHSAATAWTFFTNDAAADVLSGFGCYAIVEADALAGFCGVIHPPDFPEPELGWGLYDGFTGRGLASEAAAAILSQMFAQSARDSFVSYVMPDNTASAAVATRTGAVLDPAAKAPAGWGSLVYRHHRPNTGAST